MHTVMQLQKALGGEVIILNIFLSPQAVQCELYPITNVLNKLYTPITIDIYLKLIY